MSVTTIIQETIKVMSMVFTTHFFLTKRQNYLRKKKRQIKKGIEFNINIDFLQKGIVVGVIFLS